MSLFSKNTKTQKKKKKNIKIQGQIRLKRIQRNTCIMGFQTQIGKLNFDQTTGG